MKKLARKLHTLCVLSCSIGIGMDTPASDIPIEILTRIIGSAYADYDHPIEFTYLAMVSKTWHDILQSLHFIKLCREKGFVEPVMMFHYLSKDAIKQSDILEKDLIDRSLFPRECPSLKRCFVTQKMENFQANTVKFLYIDSKKLTIDMPFKGFFWKDNQAHIAIWVNPVKISAFNFNLSILPSNENKFFQSKMGLLQYITCYEKDQKLKEEKKNDHLTLVYDPITAEPTVSGEMQHHSYGTACVFIPAPVLAKRFVTKWPASFTFETYVPADTQNLAWGYNCEEGTWGI
jgi:hypothetical protein